MMSSRSGRAETRQSRKEDIKRVMHNVEKVSSRKEDVKRVMHNVEKVLLIFIIYCLSRH